MFTENQDSPREQNLSIPIENIRIGSKLTIKAFPTEHFVHDLPQIVPKFTEQLTSVDGVVLEYFPDEINKLRNSAAVYNHVGSGFVPFYEALAAEIHAANKNVYVLDPAHDANFGYIMGFTIISGGGVATLGWKLAGNAIDSIKANGVTPRRDFIKKLGITTIGAALVPSGVGSILHFGEVAARKPLPIPEPAFRRTIIAKGIMQLGEDLDRDPSKGQTSLLLAYPPVHWNGIKDLLIHTDKLERNFAVVSQVKNLHPTFKDSFFSRRVYKPENEGWSMVNKKEI